MSLRRSGTMNGSPPFTVSVCADATVVCDLEELRGDQWEVLRRTTDRASPPQIAGLESAFARADFMHRRTNYTGNGYTDFPGFDIYRLDGERWKLIHYYGGAHCVPEELHALADTFWKTLSLDRWVPESGIELEKVKAESR